MCDLIRRQDAIDAHYEYCNKHPDAGFPVWSLKILEDLPSAQPERKKGKWKMALTKDLIGFNTVCFRCSECNGMEYSTSPFCRVCGAKMEEGEANESD